MQLRKSIYFFIKKIPIPFKNAFLKKIETGIIKKSIYFDKNYYKETYNVQKKQAKDYLINGYKIGNNPSKYFDNNKYLEDYKDVYENGINPLLHYELFSEGESRNVTPTNNNIRLNDGVYKERKYSMAFKRIIGRIIYHSKIKKNKNAKILVVLHLFYMNSTKEIISYLKNLSYYNYDLIVTYIEGFYEQDKLDMIKEFKKDTKFIETPNKGYDIGPFVNVINRTNIDKYDIIIKLQSKSVTKNIFIYNMFFSKRDWFLNLYNGIISPFTVHKTIDALYKNKKYGLVAAKNLIVSDPKHKQNIVKEKSKVLKYMKYKDNYKYIAGTCFAIKKECLKNLKKENLKEDFFEETGRGFFSKAHMLERLICFINDKYEFYGNKVDLWRRAKWHRLEKYLYNHSDLRLLEQDKYDISYDFAYHSLEYAFHEKYEEEVIELKDIKREYFDGTIKNLNECEPYLYLNGNIDIYEEYSKYHKENNLPEMNKERFDKLIKSIKENGFNERKVIVINERNIIRDGQHRSCVLMHINGEDYKVKVLKTYSMQVDLTKAKPFSKKV